MKFMICKGYFGYKKRVLYWRRLREWVVLWDGEVIVIVIVKLKDIGR